MNEDNGIDRASSIALLKVVKGINRGDSFPLHASKEYTIGRAKDCEIIIDEGDKNASRRHALLRVEKEHVVLENLSKTNPTIVNGKGISKINLKKKDQFQVGSTVLELEVYGGHEGSPTKRRGKILGIVTGLLFIFVAVLLIITWRSSPPKKPEAVKTSKTPVVNKEEPDQKGECVASSPDVSVSEKTKVDKPIIENSNDKEGADGHFRQGMFFYEAGKVKKALEEWDYALALDRNHPHARKWLLRAEDELEILINKHYQRALVHKKYMRYREAIDEFRIVTELSRNENDERSINALRQLKELEER
jgi:hypothetical protein